MDGSSREFHRRRCGSLYKAACAYGTKAPNSDISIQTPERIGIIIELKYAEDGNLEAACREALKQIEEKKYAEGLKRQGTKKVLPYGIAFCEKECLVALSSMMAL